MKTFKIPMVVMGFAALALASAVVSARGQATGQASQTVQAPPQFKESITVKAAPPTGSTSDYFLTFSGPIGVPGVTLPAGTYLFRFPVMGASVIQVLKADRSAVYALFYTIPIEKVDRSLKSDAHEVTWLERPAGSPPAIKAWFLPNQQSGYEFMYAKAKTGTEPSQKPRFEESIEVSAASRPGSTSDYFLTFSGPVGVPGVTLPKGTYLFRFPAQGVTAIQVLAADRSTTYAMFLTIPIENVDRGVTSDNHEVTWRMRAPDAPPAIKAWFLPNRATGYEFVYPSEAGPVNY